MHHDRPSPDKSESGIDPELALRASDAIIAISADAIISIDESHRIIRYNNGAQEIFGYTPDEILGRTIDILIPERFRERHPSQIEGFAASPTVARRMGERRQISGLRKGGQEFPAEASISKTRIGDQWMFTVALRDVTDRVRAQRAQSFLAQATALLNGSLDAERTIESIAALSLPTLGDWCVVFLGGNGEPYRRALSVHTSKERAGEMRKLLEIPFTARAEQPVMRCLDKGESLLIPDFNAEVLDAWSDDGAHREILTKLNPSSAVAVPLLARATQIGAICFFFDATSGHVHDQDDLDLANELARRAGMALDNARLYALAQTAVAARDDVIAVVSHDLGNPLAAIRVSATVLARTLERRSDPDDVLMQQVDNIRSSVQHMERLIKDLLDVKRIDAGFLALDKGRVAVRVLLEEVSDAYRELAASRGVSLQCDDGAEAGFVIADHARIAQVFSNLIGNSLKFTPAGGVIRVSVAREAETMAFSVEDNGSGIPAEHLPHIFDRFWQARRTGRQSMGLGLAIVKGIIDAHGGSLRVNSELGAGTTFTFTLPSAY